MKNTDRVPGSLNRVVLAENRSPTDRNHREHGPTNHFTCLRLLQNLKTLDGQFRQYRDDV